MPSMETPAGNTRHWSQWLAHGCIDVGPAALDQLVVTAFVCGDIGYKLVKPGVAWKFHAPFRVMDRDALAMLVRVMESDREGLDELLPYRHPAIRTPPVEMLFTNLHAERSDVWVGPPPADADFVQINYGVNDFSFDWAAAQVQAAVFGPLRVRRCFHGAQVAMHKDEFEFADTLNLVPKVLRKMLKCGADPVNDKFVRITRLIKGKPRLSASWRYALSMEAMAGYEQFCAAPKQFTVAEAAAWTRMLKQGS